MIVKIKDLQHNMCVIYKINYNDGHYYIGLTVDLKRRMSEHLNDGKKFSYRNVSDCDKAIYEQGGLEEVEILEFCKEEELEERECYWIKKYNAYESPLGYNKTPGGSGSNQAGIFNANAVFSNEEVYDIRKRRYMGERKKDVYADYAQHPLSTFEKIWLGRGYTDIGSEFFIKTGSKSRQEYSSLANSGTNNGRSKVTREEVLEIRRRRENGETFVSIAKDFPQINKSTVRRIALRESYKDIE